jgi:hypothetical protein
VAKDEGHDALGWRHGVGLLEKYSRPEASLFFGADIGGGVLDREIAFGTRVTIVLASRSIEHASQVAIPICLCATKAKTQERRRRPSHFLIRSES